MPSMVVCPEPLAAKAGEHVLQARGNAADAAIAVAFAQAVVNPLLCGLGGSGAMLVSTPQSGVTVLDCAAEMGSLPVPDSWVTEYLGRSETFGRHIVRSEQNQMGYSSIMIPGFVRGCWHLFKTFGSGRLSWHELLMPAARLARRFEVDSYVASFWAHPEGGVAAEGGDGRPGYPTLAQKLRKDSAGFRLYLHPDASGYGAGEQICLDELADTIEQLAIAGGDDFYQGDVARSMLRDFAENGAFISSEDLARYHVTVHRPLRGAFYGHDIYSAPAPNSGAQLIQVLHMFELLDLGEVGHNTADYIDILARVQRASFADNVRIKGASSVEVNDWEATIIGSERTREWARRIRSGDRIRVSGGAVDAGTTHVSCLDSEGCAVAFTHSLGSSAGSGALTPGLGFFYNNLAGHLSPIPGQNDSIRPGKRFFGSMPGIIYRGDKPVFVIGAPGGSRINSAVPQALINAIVFDMDMATAVASPRFHSEEDQIIFVEPSFSDDVIRDLTARGNKVIRTDKMSRVQAIALDQAGALIAGADPRGGGGVGISDL